MTSDALRPGQTRPAAGWHVVLDTNVVLDLWLFADARCAQLRQALLCGGLTALATPAMREELILVLQRPFVANWPTTALDVIQQWDRHSQLVAPPAHENIAAVPRCSDPDDQKFIDLAWHRARWLFSRDRAVLRLARVARAHGLAIAAPECWSGAPTASPLAG